MRKKRWGFLTKMTRLICWPGCAVRTLVRKIKWAMEFPQLISDQIDDVEDDLMNLQESFRQMSGMTVEFPIREFLSVDPTQDDYDKHQARIRDVAQKRWEAIGRPEGQDEEIWEWARKAIAVSGAVAWYERKFGDN